MSDAPAWVEVIIAAAAVISAVWVLWTKAIRPTVLALGLIERITPMLAYLADQFPDHESFEQWVADSGTARREFRNRLARIERVIDFEHPPPRDWSWQNAPDPAREYDRRILDLGPLDGGDDRRE